MARLVVQYPGTSDVLVDGVVVGRTNSVIEIGEGEHRVTLSDPASEPAERTLVVASGTPSTEIVHAGFGTADESIDRYSPLYCRYNGFLLGQFLSLSFASFASTGYAERRSRMLEFLREIEVDVAIPESPPGLGDPEHSALIEAVMTAVAAKSVDLVQFTLLGALLTHYGLLARTDEATANASAEQIEVVRERYGLPALELADFVVDPEVRDPDVVLSASLAYLREIVEGLDAEPDTAFVIMPFKKPFASYFATFYRPALEQAGFRAFRAWGGLKSEDYADLLLALIGKAGMVWADVSESNPNVFYEIGAAHALGRLSMLVVREDLAGSIPANIGHDAVLKYSPDGNDWPGEPVRLMAAMIAAMRFAAERGERLRIRPDALEHTLDQVGAALAGLIVPEEAREAFMQGLARQAEGDTAGAEHAFDDAIRLGLDDAASFLARGGARLALGRFADAEADLTEVLERAGAERDETAVRTYGMQASYLRGLAREQQENLPGARDDYGVAIEFGYPGAEALRRRAFVAIRAGRLDEARLDVERARALAPDEPETIETEGDLALAEGRYAQAVASYDAALAARPNVDVEFTRALALLLDGRAREAVEGYRLAADEAEPDQLRTARNDLERLAAGLPAAAECLALLGD
jgi:tetratricopeptide (TPR) repeat protein